MKEKILITSALPYANGSLHFGHIAGAFLPADCYARFKRLQGCDVLYLSGSDEYGVAVTMSAELANRTPKEQVDLFHEINFKLLKQLEISFDHYSRTTWGGHDETVQAFFLDLLANGHIEEKETEQLFSEKENRFLADRYVQGTCPKCSFAKARGDECPSCGASYEATDLLNPVSKQSQTPLILKKTRHWFLRFDHFKEELESWLHTKKWKPNVMNFALSYVKDLKQRAITRDSEWGVPVPLKGAEGKVLYVWFDAPIGYISAAKDFSQRKGDPELWKKYWLDPQTKYVQFIGKDNIPFHAVFFPAMIMGQNTPYKQVDELPANEFYNLEGKQFSKSDGWYIDLDRFFTQFSIDQIRYVIAANSPETGDSEFAWKDFQNRCNAELLGKYGNFINRVLVFIQQKNEGKIPSIINPEAVDLEFLEGIKGLAKQCFEAYDSFQLRKASQLIMEIAQKGNVYFDLKKPWALAKDPALTSDLFTTLRCCLECIKLLALTSAPIIPNIASKVFGFLEIVTDKKTWDEIVSFPFEEGRKLPMPSILFSKVEDDKILPYVQELAQMAEKQKSKEIAAVPLKEAISIEDVKKMDLRIAEIEAVERVPKSKKLLKLSVNTGLDRRTIVAGIGEDLTEIETLVGRKIVIVANLKPASFLGIESQGMVLAAKGIKGLELPVFSFAEPGDVVS